MRNLLNPLVVASLRRYFRDLRANGYFQLDTYQCPNMRDGIYCEYWCRFFQHQVASFINRFLPEPVKPSYTWVFSYYPGGILKRHTDREQCRWNISLAIDADPAATQEDAWPIYFQVGTEAHEVRLGMGDAVIYSGTETPHWRLPSPAGSWNTMCFFHFVAADFSGSLA
jgi:hypothetical protein